jgi:hypothetical protein
MAKPRAAKKEVDWDAVEIDYRSGVKSTRMLAKEYGVSDVLIGRRAKAEKWIRDLQTQIREQAQAKIEMAVAGAAGKAKTEREVVEVNAEVQKDIILAHRTDAGNARAIFTTLLDKLSGLIESDDAIEHITKIVQASEDHDVDSLISALRKVMSLPGHATTLKTLTDSLKTLVAIEREAHGVDDKRMGSTSVDDAVKAALSRG